MQDFKNQGKNVGTVVILSSHGYPEHCAHNCNQPYDEMHQGH